MRFIEARFVGSFPDYALAPKTGLSEIAIGGRSNVGKSSLINSLLNRKNLARTSKAPGRTRLLNLFRISGKGGRSAVCLVDLPGYGYAKVATSIRQAWGDMVEGYIEKSTNLVGFLLLIDSRRGVEDEEVQLIEYLLAHGRKICPVMTKSDKLNRSEKSRIAATTAEALREFGGAVHHPILHSSKEKTGNDQIWSWVNERINNES